MSDNTIAYVIARQKYPEDNSIVKDLALDITNEERGSIPVGLFLTAADVPEAYAAAKEHSSDFVLLRLSAEVIDIKEVSNV